MDIFRWALDAKDKATERELVMMTKCFDLMADQIELLLAEFQRLKGNPMSYSFSVRAGNKADAKSAVEAAFDKMVEQQPIHARDKAAALANAGAVIDLLVDDDSQDICVSLNGYVSWRELLKDDGSNDLSTASVSANASLVAKS